MTPKETLDAINELSIEIERLLDGISYDPNDYADVVHEAKLKMLYENLTRVKNSILNLN